MNHDFSLRDEFGNEPFRAFCEVPDFIDLREQLNMAAYISYPLVAGYLFYLMYQRRDLDLLIVVFLGLMLLQTYVGMAYFQNPSLKTLGYYGIIPVIMMLYVAFIVMSRYMQWHWAAAVLALMVLLYASVKFTTFWLDKVGFDQFSTGSGSVAHLPHLMLFLILLCVLFVRQSYSRRDRDREAAGYLLAFWSAYATSTALRWFDVHLCSSIPTGTRFLAYLASAAMLYFLLRGAIEIRSSRLVVRNA